MAKTNENKDLTSWECRRIDFIQDIARNFLDSLMMKGKKVEWTMDDLDTVLTAAWNCMKGKDINFTEREFYPYRDEEVTEDKAMSDYTKVIAKVNAIEGLTAWDDKGLVCVEHHAELAPNETLADRIVEHDGFPYELDWVTSDYNTSRVWFKYNPDKQ